MTTEHSASQNQQPEKTTCTSDKRYQNSLANYVHDSQQAFGLEKYGIPLSEVPLDRYDWQLMAIEESVDMNQYLIQELRKSSEEIKNLKALLNKEWHLDNSHSLITVQQAKEMMEHGTSD